MDSYSFTDACLWHHLSHGNGSWCRWHLAIALDYADEDRLCEIDGMYLYKY
jgi:hypothetical protein